jgi:prepilin-type N-terminal cleavage/methylation domain-containing protein
MTTRTPATQPVTEPAARARPRPGAADAGFTLVEYTVAMVIFTVVIAITAGGVALMARDVVKTTNLSTSTDQIRLAFGRLDRQVRYASEINFPVSVGGGTRWYVEFLAPNFDGVPTCHQWRLDTATDKLQERSWPGPPAAAPATAPAWTTVASNMANDPVTDPPFTLVPADVDTPRQGLVIELIARKAARDTSSVTMQTSLYARNSSTQSASNSDIDGNGVSDDQICEEVDRP